MWYAWDKAETYLHVQEEEERGEGGGGDPRGPPGAENDPGAHWGAAAPDLGRPAEIQTAPGGDSGHPEWTEGWPAAQDMAGNTGVSSLGVVWYVPLVPCAGICECVCVCVGGGGGGVVWYLPLVPCARICVGGGGGIWVIFTFSPTCKNLCCKWHSIISTWIQAIQSGQKDD